MFCLIKLSIEFLLVLFFDIMSFILLSLSAYNKNHHHFHCDFYNLFYEYYARHHHDSLRIAIHIAKIIYIIIKY
jgi:hypothetical protein